MGKLTCHQRLSDLLVLHVFSSSFLLFSTNFLKPFKDKRTNLKKKLYWRFIHRPFRERLPATNFFKLFCTSL